MNISPSSLVEEGAQRPTRVSSVIMGRLDYLSVTLRLIGMELYKLRRRRMSKVVGSIAFALAIILFLLISLGTLFTLNAPAESFAPPCNQSSSTGNPATPQAGQPSNCPTPT